MVAEFTEAGGPGGLSFSASVPQQSLTKDGNGGAGALPIAFAADMAAWSDDDRLAAGEKLRKIGSVEVGRLIELSAADVAKVIVELPVEIWDELLLGAAGNYLYDAVKALVAKRRTRSVVEIRRGVGDDQVIARLETDDPALAERALKNLGQSVPSSATGKFVFDPEQGLWVPPTGEEN